MIPGEWWIVVDEMYNYGECYSLVILFSVHGQTAPAEMLLTIMFMILTS